MKNLQIYFLISILAVILVILIDSKKEQQQVVVDNQWSRVEIPKEIVPIKPQSYNITAYPTDYLNYNEVINFLKKWNIEAPEITEFGEYGKTKQGTTCHYLRMGTIGKPEILIHACIHGNERLAAASLLQIMGKILNDYGRESEVTWLLENRNIYFVPVLSPDTYLKSRHVEGVDPNRDYPRPNNPDKVSASPLIRIQEFCKQHKFAGVMSCHTTGRIYLYPSLCTPNDKQKHIDLANQMAKMSGYRVGPISNSDAGYEIDWYYWKGGSVSILTELAVGSHEQPSKNIPIEANANYKAFLWFIKTAPEISLTNKALPAKYKSNGSQNHTACNCCCRK